jgi:hypothetical protein
MAARRVSLVSGIFSYAIERKHIVQSPVATLPKRGTCSRVRATFEAAPIWLK